MELWGGGVIMDMEYKIFMADIIGQICDYATDHGMDPDDTLKTIATNILQFTEIASCAGWNKEV